MKKHLSPLAIIEMSAHIHTHTHISASGVARGGESKQSLEILHSSSSGTRTKCVSLANNFSQIEFVCIPIYCALCTRNMCFYEPVIFIMFKWIRFPLFISLIIIYPKMVWGNSSVSLIFFFFFCSNEKRKAQTEWQKKRRKSGRRGKCPICQGAFIPPQSTRICSFYGESLLFIAKGCFFSSSSQITINLYVKYENIRNAKIVMKI